MGDKVSETSTSPPEELARVECSCGRYYLAVAGVAVAMEGDKCRDSSIPEEVLDAIPEAELAVATIGDKPAKDLPLSVVRFFRGDCWNKAMLQWVAARINDAARKAETLTFCEKCGMSRSAECDDLGH